MNEKSDPKNPNLFVTQLDTKKADSLLSILKDQSFEISTPPYTIFSAKKKGVSCTFYQSGKLVVQGKEAPSFIEFYLEPEVLESFNYTYQEHDQKADTHPHIGIDESGKGDFFGPLCVAGVFADDAGIRRLKEIGVRDSKDLGEDAIIKIGNKIKAEFVHQIVKINPLKYNELYKQFANLNKLLAWGHATAIEELVRRTECLDVIIDQFASEHVVITALKRKKLDISLVQRHRGEEDLVVAAASILARQAFVEGLAKLEVEFGQKLPKGASAQTIAAGRKLYQRMGKEGLEQVGKLHFKTLDAILDSFRH